MTTVVENFDIHYMCWQDYGPCSAAHTTHIHISRNPDFNNQLPKCKGGSAGWEPPGSQGILDLHDEIYKRFPGVHAPGPGLGIFNCRPIAGTSPAEWSDHAYANAVDVSGSSSLLDKVWDWLNGDWEEDWVGEFKDSEIKALHNLLDGLTETQAGELRGLIVGAEKRIDGKQLASGDGEYRRTGYAAAYIRDVATEVANHGIGMQEEGGDNPPKGAFNKAGHATYKAGNP